MSTLIVSNISDGTTTVNTSYVTNGTGTAKTMWAANLTSGATYMGLGPGELSDKSLNVTSFVDSAVGTVVINLTSAFGTEPIVVFGVGNTNNTATLDGGSTYTTVEVRVNDADSSNAQDNWHACAMFGDLA